MGRWCGSLVASFGLLWAAQAKAETCESDDDCGKGEWCADEAGNHGGGGVAEPAPCAPDEDGGCEQPLPPDAPELTCQSIGRGACESDADCSDGLVCRKPTSVAGCPPPAEPGATDECSDEPQVERYGYCSYEPPACESDDECLEGLQCTQNPEGSASNQPGTGGGGADDVPVAKSDAKVCVFAPPTCKETAECADDYECAEVLLGGGCSGSTGACSSDGECEEPVEEECDERSENYCLPKEQACSDDDGCPSAWKCLAFGEDALITLPNWSDKAGKRCVPEGLALVLASHQSGGGFGASDGESPNAGGDESSAPTAKDGSSSGGSCSVTARSRASAIWPALLGLAAVFAWRRRAWRAHSSSRR